MKCADQSMMTKVRQKACFFLLCHYISKRQKKKKSHKDTFYNRDKAKQFRRFLLNTENNSDMVPSDGNTKINFKWPLP